MFKNIRYLFSLPFSSLFTLMFLKFTGKEFLISGKCNCCGKCCKNINLRSQKGWLRQEKDFLELKEECSEYDRYVIISRDEQGHLQFNCSFFDTQNGCLDYANRPEICKKYPNKSLLLQGGKLLDGCGYSVKIGTPFTKHLRSQMKKKNV